MTFNQSHISWLCLLSILLNTAPAFSQPAAAEKSATGLTALQAVREFYRPDDVQSVHLTVAEADLKKMLSSLPELVDVPATFRWRDLTIENVAIRFKGNSSSNPKQSHKRSYLIKFEDADHRFFGLRQTSLDNGVQFGSLFSEPIITEILREHGVETHRCNYARLYLNKAYQGVYVNVERIDESFIANHFSGAAGSLFKVNLGGPGSNLQFIGNDPAPYRKTFEAKNKAAKKDVDAPFEFIKWINQSQPAAFAKNIDAKLELDDFLRTTAIMLNSGAFDQLTGWNPHNYFLFHDSKKGRWRYMPWDLDVGFAETAFGKIKVLAEWHAAWPVTPGAPNPLLERIVSDPRLLERYRKECRTILEKSFEPERLCRIIDDKYKLIREDLKTDPFPHRRITGPGDREYDDIVESLKSFVRKRYALSLKQLDEPGERPKFERTDQGGLPPALAAKIEKVVKAAEEMQRKGVDVSPIAAVMQKVGPALQKGQIAEAEKLLDEALKLVGEKK